jgi:hypothetical protein
MIELHVTGIDSVRDAFKELGGPLPAKVVRATLAKITTPIRKAFVSASPVNSGALKKSFGKRNYLYQRTGEIVSFVGVRGDFELKHAKTTVTWKNQQGEQSKVVYRDHKPILYAMKVENFSNKNRGWMKRVWEAQLPIAMAAFNREIWNQLQVFAAKKAAKAAKG